MCPFVLSAQNVYFLRMAKPGGNLPRFTWPQVDLSFNIVELSQSYHDAVLNLTEHLCFSE